MKEESLLLLSDLQKLINQVVLIDYTIIILGDNFMDILGTYHPNKGIAGNCLSTEKRTNGAAAIFLPGVARRLSELLGSDLYLVFTSVHEVMVHNADVVYPEDLKEVLSDTLEKATPEEDYLTSSIYRYSRRSGEFSVELK